jgi:hypothetical protein
MLATLRGNLGVVKTTSLMRTRKNGCSRHHDDDDGSGCRFSSELSLGDPLTWADTSILIRCRRFFSH